MVCPSSEVGGPRRSRRRRGGADQGPMLCAVLCAVCLGPIDPWRGETPGRGAWADTDGLLRTRCRHLLSGGSQVRNLPGAPPEQGFSSRRGLAGRKCVQKSLQWRTPTNAYELVRTQDVPRRGAEPGVIGTSSGDGLPAPQDA